jgi:hypothetical protein
VLCDWNTQNKQKSVLCCYYGYFYYIDFQTLNCDGVIGDFVVSNVKFVQKSAKVFVFLLQCSTRFEFKE